MTRYLYIGNLSRETTEETLRTLFGQDGREVKGVDIIKTKSKQRPKSRGFGFVEFTSAEHAEAARTALDGTNLDGREIRVREASAKRSGEAEFLSAYGQSKRKPRDDDRRGGGGRRW